MDRFDLCDRDTTLTYVRELCERATMLTYHHDGSLSITIDGPIYRECYRLNSVRTCVSVTLMTGYDADKHAWLKCVGQSLWSIPNKRGQKALDKWLEELNLKHHPFPRPRIASYFRKDGELKP